MALGLIIASIVIVFLNIGVEYYINEHIRVNDVLVMVLLLMAITLA